jgi:Tfp pilus assembly protein PilF
MIQRRTLGPALLLLSALCLPSCSTPDPTPKQVTARGPQFDADYYAKNAKEYIDAGRYGQAKDQWMKQLQKDPDNWMAHLGIAYSDYFLSEESVVAHRNLDEARTRLKAAETRFRQLRSGPIEADTTKIDPQRPQWKAELGLALTKRRLGVVDRMDAQRSTQLATQGGPNASKAADRAAELAISSDQAYAEAISMFTGLAYMQHASPEAIQNLAELYVVTKQDALAEREYRRYLEIAERSQEMFEAKKKEVSKDFQPNAQEMAIAAYDEKLASNAQKRVSVLAGLADLAFARGDYTGARQYLDDALKVDPNYRDLYIKLAQAEYRLDMLESALEHVNEYLRRAGQRNEEFGDKIRDAMKLKGEIEKKMRERGK